ncbi:MAG: lipid II-degrading bacteriocin [Rhodospirillales bacterium]|nr:lipid II-degrading bacteriocin [Rhodospirillales bacterium]
MPRLGSDQVADAGIVPVVNAEEEETGNEVPIAQQDDKPPAPARKKITGPEAALDHYMSGSGETVEYPFDQIVTENVRPSDFPAIRDILRRGRPGSYKVQGRMPFSSPNYKARYSVGNITLNVNGTLVLDEEGNYSFKGEMGAEPDRYRFYSSDHRDTTAEIATQIGRLLPGREFTVIISGQKPISTTGRYLPSATY